MSASAWFTEIEFTSGRKSLIIFANEGESKEFIKNVKDLKTNSDGFMYLRNNGKEVFINFNNVEQFSVPKEYVGTKN